MKQEFTMRHGEVLLRLEEHESGWIFTRGTTTIQGIREELFTAHCERLKRSLSKDIPHEWETWKTYPFPERIFTLVSCWRLNGIHFLEDCVHFPFAENEIPKPLPMADGAVDMQPVLDYLKQWREAAGKRHYPLPSEKQMDYIRQTKILSQFWGFRECDSFYKEKPYDFLTETIKKPLGKKEFFPSCHIYVGQAPNGRWAVNSHFRYDNVYGAVWCRYQFPHRDAAILHEISTLKDVTRHNKEVKNRQEVLDWLESLETSLIQPELFAFAG